MSTTESKEAAAPAAQPEETEEAKMVTIEPDAPLSPQQQAEVDRLRTEQAATLRARTQVSVSLPFASHYAHECEKHAELKAAIDAYVAGGAAADLQAAVDAAEADSCVRAHAAALLSDVEPLRALAADRDSRLALARAAAALFESALVLSAIDGMPRSSPEVMALALWAGETELFGDVQGVCDASAPDSVTHSDLLGHLGCVCPDADGYLDIVRQLEAAVAARAEAGGAPHAEALLSLARVLYRPNKPPTTVEHRDDYLALAPRCLEVISAALETPVRHRLLALVEPSEVKFEANDESATVYPAQELYPAPWTPPAAAAPPASPAPAHEGPHVAAAKVTAHAELRAYKLKAKKHDGAKALLAAIDAFAAGGAAADLTAAVGACREWLAGQTDNRRFAAMIEPATLSVIREAEALVAEIGPLREAGDAAAEAAAGVELFQTALVLRALGDADRADPAVLNKALWAGESASVAAVQAAVAAAEPGSPDHCDLLGHQGVSAHDPEAHNGAIAALQPLVAAGSAHAQFALCRILASTASARSEPAELYAQGCDAAGAFLAANAEGSRLRHRFLALVDGESLEWAAGRITDEQMGQGVGTLAALEPYPV